MTARKPCMALLVLLLAPTGAAVAATAPAAAGAERGVAIALEPGYSIAAGAAADVLSGSPYVGVSGAARLAGPVRAGLELGYSFAHRLEGTSGGYDFTSDSDASMLHAGPFVSGGFGPRNEKSRWGFDSIVGLGVYRLSQDAGTATFPSLGRTVAVSGGSNAYFGFNIGFLCRFRLRRDLDLGVAWRYHYIVTPGDDDAFIIPGLRLSLAF